MMGWSIMVNVIGVMLVYFYLPPSHSGLTVLLAQTLFLGVFNLMSIITSSGRIIDAFYDPFIGRMSDSFHGKRGKRTPFMLLSILPSVVLCILIFIPPTRGVSNGNTLWLFCTLTLFYMATTTYIIPYYALLPELARNKEDRIKLSSFQQVGFVAGMIVGSLVNNIADYFSILLKSGDRTICIQWAIGLLSVIGGILMLAPVLVVNEKKYCISIPSATPLRIAIKESFRNKNFIYFLISYSAFFMALFLIENGMLYFVTVLAGLPASEGSKLVAFMVLLSLLFYPVVIRITGKYGYRKILILSFILLSAVFAGIALLGKLHIASRIQLYTLLGLASFPLASLGILPNAIIAGIAESEGEKTGDSREGLFFAVNYFFAKLGQTLGITIFSLLTIFGKDSGHDLGLRLSGVTGCVLCVFAAFIFRRYKEQK
jgi:GPH family glycoside/pentoside/hexuronide:cation symporter